MSNNPPKSKRRKVRVLLLHPGQPDRWATIDPNFPAVKRILLLLDSAFPPVEDLLFYAKDAPEPNEPAAPYHCFVRGKPAWGQVMILKRAGTELVNLDRADVPRAYAHITKKRRP